MQAAIMAVLSRGAERGGIYMASLCWISHFFMLQISPNGCLQNRRVHRPSPTASRLLLAPESTLGYVP
jgi:hypothetical protein